MDCFINYDICKSRPHVKSTRPFKKNLMTIYDKIFENKISELRVAKADDIIHKAEGAQGNIKYLT